MKKETYDALLKALQKLEKALVKEGVAAARSDKDLKDKLLRLHRESETGGSLDNFIEVAARRSAVQFLLRTVYVRVLEDLGLLEEPRIRGDRGFHAFREVAPGLDLRAYWKWTFRDLAEDFPALFTPREDELPLPGEDLCKDVWELWRAQDGRSNLRYDWSDGNFDGRFLGDLYQDLDADVRKRYALRQTPEFVESYILDHALNPALAQFDPEQLRTNGKPFRVLDPTCGSGHFLVGAFRRLFDYWENREFDGWDAATRAAESISGCDINSYAVDIARFRMILEVIARTGVRDLARIGRLELDVAVLDSLVPWERSRGQLDLYPGSNKISQYGDAVARLKNCEFLAREFHVVVGNPPYIAPTDPQKRDDYREFWPGSVVGKYSLSAPFVERFFVLATDSGFVGMINGNAIMKRSFGRHIIERTLPKYDITHIVDCQGASIPEHEGIPTMIMFGRCQLSRSATVRVTVGLKASSDKTLIAHKDPVWRSISEHTNDVGFVNEYIEVMDVTRESIARHPWHFGSDKEKGLLKSIEARSARLGQLIEFIGFNVVTSAKNLLHVPPGRAPFWGVESLLWWPLVDGSAVRDYCVHISEWFPVPYDEELELIPVARFPRLERFVWPHRSWLSLRFVSGGTTMRDIGLEYHAIPQFSKKKARGGLSIVYSEVSTHVHFAIVNGPHLFDQTAPVLKLRGTGAIEDYLNLLGLLNTSVSEYWCKQRCHNKRYLSERFEDFYQRASERLRSFPICDSDRDPRIVLVRAIHNVASTRATCLTSAILASRNWTPEDLPEHLAAARDRYRDLTRRMVALQEELDWLTYGSYGLLQGHETLGPTDVEPIAPGHRPFEILLARHNAACDPDERSAWFARHGHDETPTIPDQYSQATRDRITERLRLIASNPDIRLIEQPQFKRRWQLADLPAETKTAATDWLLDRLEDLFAPADDTHGAGPLAQPRPYRLEEIAAAWSTGPQGARILAVAKVLTGTADLDLAQIAERLLRDHAIPDNPFRVYTSEGSAKLRKWQHVWALQDREDAGEKVKIPEPPDFSRDDFTHPRYFQIRGKLNVPRERFVRFADLSPPAYGWNGWRDRDRAMAQVDAYTHAEQHPTEPLPAPTAADPRRCGATVGLWESLPDLRRWGDPATREGEYGELLALAREACHQQQCPCDVVQAWQKWTEGKLQIGGAGEDPAAPAPVTGEERDRLTRSLILFGKDGATLADLDPHWFGPPKRLAQVLDELIASGDVAGKGRGKAQRRYRLTRP